jgi:hypothetical protein
MNISAPAYLLCGILLLTGCAAPTAKAPKESGAAAEVKQAFAHLQAALKDRSGPKIWALLADDSRQDAEREARHWKEKYGKADEKGKAELAKKLGLPPAKLQELTGKTFLESDLFFHFDEHNEIPDVKKLEKISVQGDTAKVEYQDPDKPELMMRTPLVREDGHWRFNMSIPRAVE